MNGARHSSPTFRYSEPEHWAGQAPVIEIRIGIATPDTALRVPAEQDSLPVVRQVLRSLGETVDAEREALEDAELAVTEAMANAVEHAYVSGAEGDVAVDLIPRGNELRVVVADTGVGISPDVSPERDRGFGLSMIESIASRFEVAGGEGTELKMDFAMGRSELETVDGAAPGIDPAERILRRLVAVVAAQADLPSDRMVEALLVTELVARHALRHLVGDEIEITVDRSGHAFELRVGPLEVGGADQVVASTEIPAVGSVVERLSDGVRTEPGDGVERLVIKIESGR